MSGLGRRRRAGLLIPLFSCPSQTSWGIGEIPDLAPMAAWLASAGQRVLQLLPLNEMAPGQQSPYSAISAMAIDPIFISLAHVPEFDALGGEASLTRDEHRKLEEVRRSPAVRHREVRRLKSEALRASFRRFVEAERCRGTDRAAAMQRFVSEQAWWIEDHAFFRAVHAREDERPWTEWPEPLQRREPRAVDDTRRELADEILFYQYLQWIVAEQWTAVRRATRRVAIFGDLPFMVDRDSADVWARQSQFLLDASVGVPPDAFSAEGQDWGMPVYDWEAIRADGFRWLRERARRASDLYDGYRIDHLVGFYRTYGRPLGGGSPFFSPADEAAQTVNGEQVLAVFRESGAEIVVEDLGTVPDFVRASLARLEIPGFRVLRWEREWHTEGEPFRDPADYPSVSVATSGTHDTESLAVWWQRAPESERRLVADLPTVRRIASARDMSTEPYIPAVRDVLLESLFASGSELLLNPLPDAFGWATRINEPAVVSDENWTFRLPWPSDRLDEIPEARERRDRLKAWSEQYGR